MEQTVEKTEVKKATDILLEVENDIWDVVAVTLAGHDYAQNWSDNTGAAEGASAEINGAFDYCSRLFTIIHEKLEAIEGKLDNPVLHNLDK